MSESHLRSSTSSGQHRIDQLCDELETQWKAGVQPDLDAFVRRLDSSDRTNGLIELVVLDHWYRSRHRAAHRTSSNLQEEADASSRTKEPLATSWQSYVLRYPELAQVTPPSELADARESEASLVGERFLRLRPVAAGGLGKISVARDLNLERDVAIKEMQSRFASDVAFRNRFLREAEITAQLEHPCIAPVYVRGQHQGGFPWYAMRLIPGDSLLDAINGPDAAAARDAFDVRQRQLVQAFLDVCQAVEYAHSRGVIHRDIKPQNIILGEYGETFLVDWGLARRVDEADAATGSDHLESPDDRTQAGTVMGTPSYMSPEQESNRNDPVDLRSDVFALGATLWHILTGSPPNKQLARAQVAAPRALRAICVKAMANDPADRYSTVSAMAQDVELALADQPVTACNDPLTTRFRRWFKRNRVWTAAAGAAASVAFLAMAAISWINAANASQLLAKNQRLDELVHSETVLRQQAEQSDRDTRDALEYLIHALRSPDPNRDGRDVKVADVLQRSVDRLDEDFAENSVIKARLLSAIAQTLVGLGMVNEARPLAEQAWRLCRNQVGEHERLTLNTKWQVARVYWRLADDRAVPMMTELIRDGKQQWGADDPDVLEFESSHAILQMESGETTPAIETFQRHLPILVDLFGDDSARVLHVMNNLANACYYDGQIDRAVELSRDLYAARQRLNGPDALSTIVAGSNYAAHLLKSSDPAAAMAELEDLLQRARQHLGNQHYQTLILMTRLGDNYVDRNDMDRAWPLLNESLELSESEYGFDHPRTLVAANAVSIASLQRGDYSRAISLFQRVHRHRIAGQGEQHPETLTVANNLASAYYLDQQYEKAIDLFEPTLAVQRVRQGNHHHGTIRTMVNLASALPKLGRVEESTSLANEALQLSIDHLGADHAQVQNALSALGEGHLAAGEHALARDAFSKCLEIRQRRIPTHYLTFHTMSQLGEALMELGDYDQAGEVLHEAWNRLEAAQSQVPERAKYRVTDARNRLIRFFELTGQDEKANALRSGTIDD